MLRWLMNLFIREPKTIIAAFNAEGFPIKDLTWKKAVNIYKLPIYSETTITNHPSKCELCNKPLIHEEWDWWSMQSGGQYMVHTYTCPNGHGHYGDWA
jgi:hypothetical protein